MFSLNFLMTKNLLIFHLFTPIILLAAADTIQREKFFFSSSLKFPLSWLSDANMGMAKGSDPLFMVNNPIPFNLIPFPMIEYAVRDEPQRLPFVKTKGTQPISMEIRLSTIRTAKEITSAVGERMDLSLKTPPPFLFVKTVASLFPEEKVDLSILKEKPENNKIPSLFNKGPSHNKFLSNSPGNSFPSSSPPPGGPNSLGSSELSGYENPRHSPVDPAKLKDEGKNSKNSNFSLPPKEKPEEGKGRGKEPCFPPLQTPLEILSPSAFVSSPPLPKDPELSLPENNCKENPLPTLQENGPAVQSSPPDQFLLLKTLESYTLALETGGKSSMADRIPSQAILTDTVRNPFKEERENTTPPETFAETVPPNSIPDMKGFNDIPPPESSPMPVSSEEREKGQQNSLPSLSMNPSLQLPPEAPSPPPLASIPPSTPLKDSEPPLFSSSSAQARSNPTEEAPLSPSMMARSSVSSAPPFIPFTGGMAILMQFKLSFSAPILAQLDLSDPRDRVIKKLFDDPRLIYTPQLWNQSTRLGFAAQYLSNLAENDPEIVLLLNHACTDSIKIKLPRNLPDHLKKEVERLQEYEFSNQGLDDALGRLTDLKLATDEDINNLLEGKW